MKLEKRFLGMPHLSLLHLHMRTTHTNHKPRCVHWFTKSRYCHRHSVRKPVVLVACSVEPGVYVKVFYVADMDLIASVEGRDMEQERQGAVLIDASGH